MGVLGKWYVSQPNRHTDIGTRISYMQTIICTTVFAKAIRKYGHDNTTLYNNMNWQCKD